VIIALALALMLAPALVLAPAAARDPDVVAGEAAYREGRWDDASVAFDAAWRRSGDPTFLYTRAQVERRAGRCDKAIELFEQFLGTSPAAEAEAAARRYLEECRASLPPPDPVAADPVPAPVPPVGDEPPPPVAPARPTRRWSRDPLAPVLVSIGGAAMVGGAALLGIAATRFSGARDEPDDRRYADRVAGARRLEIAGATILPIGTALVIGGIVRWALLARGARQSCRVSRGSASKLLPRGW
jgi:hypothetical protein